MDENCGHGFDATLQAQPRRRCAGRRWLTMLLAAVVLVPGATSAATYSALIRWRPSSAAAGYRVYMRSLDVGYGRGSDIGAPAPESDGAVATTWGGLDTKAGYAAVVTAYDAAGNESVPSNELTIGPLEDPAPPPPAHEFGSSTIGTLVFPMVGDRKLASPFPLDQLAPVTRLWVYVANPLLVAQRARAVIYADAGGTPGALLGIGTEVRLAGGSGPDWIPLPFDVPLALTPATYWLGVLTSGGGAVLSVGGPNLGASLQNADAYADGPSTPFGAAASGLGVLSIYAEYGQPLVTTTALPAHYFGAPGATQVSVPLLADRKRVSPFALAEPARVPRLWMYLANAGPAWQMLRAVVYTDDGGGAPGPLVQMGSEVVLPPGTAATWVALPFDVPIGLDPGTYWLGALSGGANAAASYFVDPTTAVRAHDDDPYVDDASDPFGGATVEGGVIGIYAEYDPEGIGPPPTVGHYFGDWVVEGMSQILRSNREHVSAFDLTEPASVTRLQLYLANPGDRAQVLRGVIYADTAGSPDALVAAGDEVSVDPGTPPGWVALSFPTPVVLAPGRYWLGDLAGPVGSCLYYFGTERDARIRRPDDYVDGPSDLFRGGTVGIGPISVYAEYTPVP